jgi:uncharacterized protein (TIGR03435 family)
MIPSLINHIWQSMLFAVVAGLLTFVFRKNRAQVRYWLWLSSSLKFFVPFSLLIGLASHLQWAPSAREVATQITTPEVSTRIVQISQPFPAAIPLMSPEQASHDWNAIIVFAVWACGFAGVALLRLRGALLIRSAVRSSTPAKIAAPVEVRFSPGLLEPGVVRILRPILLLPTGIEDRLTPPELEAVLAHELCHVRRRDNLFAAIHMLVEALFWFLPRVWWIGGKLVEERERACDEEVLQLGTDPQVYAEAILNVCKLYAESPLVCVAGVTGSDIKKRIEAIMTHRPVVKLNFGRKLALAAAGIAALAVPIAVGILNAPPVAAQSTKVKSASIPKWEVVSIRPAKDCDIGPGPAAAKDVKKNAVAGPPPGPSPGRLNMCVSLSYLIPQAYVYNASGQARTTALVVVPIPMEGAPAWLDSSRFQINAKAEGTPSYEMLTGPMMRALLEDRFKLKIRRENRDVPGYALTVAKGGSKLQAVPGTCPGSPPGPPSPNDAECGPTGAGRKGANMTWGFIGTADQFSKILVSQLDRPVADKTGLTGLFNFHLEFAPDETSPGFLRRMQKLEADGPPPDPTGGTSLFTALQEQLGLKLEPAKVPREILVIDHVEKPSEN